MFILAEPFLADAVFTGIKTAGGEQYPAAQVKQEKPIMNLEPLHVPYRYQEQDAPEQKVIYALGQLGEANPQEIIAKLLKSNPQENLTEPEAEVILKNYFDHGMVKGDDEHGSFRYNLSKILTPNSGRTNIEGLEQEL